MIGFMRKKYNIWDTTYEEKKKQLSAKESTDVFSDDENDEENNSKKPIEPIKTPIKIPIKTPIKIPIKTPIKPNITQLGITAKSKITKK